MKKFSIKNLILILLAIAVAVTSVWLPGFLMHKDTQKYYNTVDDVPSEYYSGPSESIIANASRQLNQEQCIQLITGVWESKVSPASPEDCVFNEFGIKTLVINHVQDLYSKGLYPCNLSSNTDNWYTWEAHAYRALDSTFKTYAAYFWDITFIKYDNSETHRFITSDQGDILYCEARVDDGMGVYTPDLSNAASLLTYYQSGQVNGTTVYYTTYSTEETDDKITSVTISNNTAYSFETNKVTTADKKKIQQQIDNSSSFINDFTSFEPDDSIWLTQIGGTSGKIKYSISTKSTYNNYQMILIPEKAE